MSDLITWLRAILDDEEQVARDLDHSGWAAEGTLVTAETATGGRRIIGAGLRVGSGSGDRGRRVCERWIGRT